MRKTLQKFAAVLNALETGVLCLLMGGMIVLSLLQIAVRKLPWLEHLLGNLAWSSDCLNGMLLWLAMLGALAATKARKHIQIDLGSHLFNDRVKGLLAAVTQCFAAAIAGLLAFAAGRYVWEVRSGQGEAFLGVPEWIVFTIMPVALGLMTIRFLVQARLAFDRFRTGQKDKRDGKEPA